jgi:hypothetical protein
MAYERSVTRYGALYEALLRLYPRPYRERFGEGMAQLFGDLCREHAAAGRSPRLVAAWMFLETGVAILRENLVSMRMGLMLRKPTAWLPIALPLAMLAFMLSWFAIFGVVHSHDEGTPAHIFQLWVLVQLVAVAAFAARWLPRAPRPAMAILLLQIVSSTLPLGTVFALGL